VKSGRRVAEHLFRRKTSPDMTGQVRSRPAHVHEMLFIRASGANLHPSTQNFLKIKITKIP
jgi:hypothetical protein